jgi:DnaJ-class molecular chaperone
MEFKDYYATLGVPKTASAKEIKQAFRKLARRYHPDVNPGDKAAEAKFKDVNEANEVLGDPETRKKYDELGANWRMYERQAEAGGSPFPGGGAWQGGGPSGYRTMTPEEAEELFGDSSPFSDFFTTFFGGATREPRTREARRRQRAGQDVEHEIALSLEEAQAGVTRRLTLSYGGGTRSVDVRIPAGVGDGSRVRVPGEGIPGTGGAAAGNLYLRVRLEPHPTFERKGRDLYSDVVVPVTSAVLGGEAEVRTLGGKTARLRIPPLTQNGQVFRLKGYGMPAVGRPDETGDLYARVEVQLPTQLSAEAREHYEALARLAGTDTAAAGATRKGTS